MLILMDSLCCFCRLSEHSLICLVENDATWIGNIFTEFEVYTAFSSEPELDNGRTAVISLEITRWRDVFYACHK